MTLPTTHNRKDYTGGGGVTVFPYDFLILEASALRVYVADVLQTLTTHYSVSGVGNNGGGNVTFVTAPSADAEIVILRATVQTQAVDLLEGDRLPAATVETIFDRVYSVVQDLAEAVGRAFKWGPTDTHAVTGGPTVGDSSDLAGKVLKVSSDGLSLEGVTILPTDIASPIIAEGDLIQGGTGGAPERLAVGSASDLLTVSSGKAAWASLANRLLTLLTVNGDLLYRNGAGAVVRLPVGTEGQRLGVVGGIPTWEDAVSANPTGEVKNLVVKHNATNPDFQVDITADAIDIEGNRATSVTVTLDLTASGANGLDTGAEASSTTYYRWLIRKSSDGTVAGLWSLSSTAPTMPAGYDQKRLIGHARNNGSSNLIRTVQQNDLVLGDLEDMQVANAISASADLDCSIFVPADIADMVLLNWRVTDGGARWGLDDKDDTSIRYALLGSNSADSGAAWARKNASNLIRATEVSGTTTFSAWVSGWKVKVL